MKQRKMNPAGCMIAILAAALILAGILLAVRYAGTHLRPAEEPQEAESEVKVAGAPAEAEEEATAPAYEEYIEGDGPAPEWYDPTEPMAVEWEEERIAAAPSGPRNDEEGNAHPAEWEKPKNADLVLTVEEEPEVVTRDIGCPDWNLESGLCGWDGHRAEIWELDLMSRVFYLEFWQPDEMLCEAGCDAILRLWESGEKGRTLGEVLCSQAENGAWTYSTYPEVWATDYDPDGLAWCRMFCEARFYAGPVWIAPYFRLDYYHDWAVPAYQIGNVYFSVPRG